MTLKRFNRVTPDSFEAGNVERNLDELDSLLNLTHSGYIKIQNYNPQTDTVPNNIGVVYDSTNSLLWILVDGTWTSTANVTDHSDLSDMPDTTEANTDHDARYGHWKIEYVFEDATERDAFFTANPGLLVTDTLIVIKDPTEPITPGTRNLDFSKNYNSQYKILLYP